MSGVRKQNVGLALGELQDDAEYKKVTDPAVNDQALQFRQGVQTTHRLCFQTAPGEATEGDIGVRLAGLHAACVGPLARFRHFIEKAQAALAA